LKRPSGEERSDGGYGAALEVVTTVPVDRPNAARACSSGYRITLPV